MKRPLILLLTLFVFAATLGAAPSDAQWKKVDRFMEKRLPQSALKVIAGIEKAARAEKDWPQAVRAMATRILIASEQQTDRPEFLPAQLQEAIATAPAEMLPLLHVLEAEWFYDYLNRIEWDYEKRTPGSGSADLATWDLKRLLTETDARFAKALSSTPLLQKTPIGQWDGLLPAGALPDSYMPTLYDFVAGEALTFYTMAQQAALQLTDVFEFDENSPALGTMEEFLAWQPQPGPSAESKAIRLFQAVLTFHKNDADPRALVITDLQRLEWVREKAGGRAATRALQHYTALYQKYAAHEISLRARSLAAYVLDDDSKSVEARQVLKDGLAAFPTSLFSVRCREQLRDIERKSLNITTEFIWNAAQPQIVMNYRNLNQAFFRLYLVAENPEPALVLKGRYPDSKEVKSTLKKTQPLRAWQTDLPPAEDFQLHRHSIPAPQDLKSGYYLLCVSGDAGFTEKQNQVEAAYVWVTPLALVTRARRLPGVAILESWVLDAVSGEPVPGAEVTRWWGDGKNLLHSNPVTTDALGMASFESGLGHLFVKYEGHTVLSEYSGGGYNRPGKDNHKATLFFTDRSIYRPGQTIQFKGVHYYHDREQKDYHTLPREKRHIKFFDENGREIATVDTATNDFGSFSGRFTAPAGGFTGTYYLTDGDGRVEFSVEEYKRPKFRVEVEPPAAAPKLGEEATVKVRATAYTGAPVDGASVKWRVEREAQWSSWVRSRYSDDQEITHGVATTGADGSAELKFRLVPDKTAGESSATWFTYRIFADVTDTAGETRSSERTLSAGYTAIKSELTANAWQTPAAPVAITVHTTSLDGEPQPAEGTLTVHRLVPPDKVHRQEAFDRSYGSFSYGRTVVEKEEKDLASPEEWETGELIQQDKVQTGANGESAVSVKLAAGAYRAALSTKDRFGKEVSAKMGIIVTDPGTAKFPVRLPFRVVAPSWEVQPGENFSALWGTGYDEGRAFIEIEHRQKIVQRFWTDKGRTQQQVVFPVTEDHRGGFTIYVTQMQENRLSTSVRQVSVPWANKKLTLQWDHLTSKLEPGAKDTWTLTVAGPGKEKVAAEMAAVLYDASLDALKPHAWDDGFGCFYRDEVSSQQPQSPNGSIQGFASVVSGWWGSYEEINENRRRWAWIAGDEYGSSKYGNSGFQFELMRRQKDFSDEFDPPQIPQTFGGGGGGLFGGARRTYASSDGGEAASSPPPPPEQSPPQDLSIVSARRNMQETAFFFPHLNAADDGSVKISFTMPESVTAWKFFGFVHDKGLRSGLIEGGTVTARDLMVQPNPPRFLREGDAVEFTVKITNQSAAPLQGTARLNFSDAATMAPADAALGNQKLKQEFSVPAKESRTLSWRITVPDGQGFLAWKAVAATEKMSDGEEGWLPVLSRRVALTESIAMPLRDAGTKEFAFKKLLVSAASPSLRHQSLTVQMVSQPAWYAVMALPYLMEYPHECSEQTFNRFYANALARHIAKSDPKIHRVFEVWRDAQPEAMKSPLEKNGELKSVMIEETPWLREAKADSRSSLGVLFDDNRLDDEMLRTLKRLTDLQSKDGSWPWFPGAPSSEFITLYILAGFGRLQHLGVELPGNPAVNALDRLDVWLAGEYSDISKNKSKERNHLTSMIALYLYGRSFYLADVPVPPEHREVTDYFLEQARRHWTDLPRMSQAHAALGLLRFGDAKTAAAIAASLKERALKDEETGMHWADGRDLWMWNQAPVETQAMMIEVFREVSQDAQAVDDCQVWLLKQKQTHAWPTTKATSDACYAILLGGGAAKLASDSLVNVSLGGAEVKPEKVEAGTGFFEKKFAPADIKPDMGTVKLVKTDPGVAWGSLSWQYTEDMAKITPHEGTPLKVTKALFIKINTPAGPELRAVQAKVKVGDELVVRLELRADRDMEFVHLKDQRPSSVEPVNVLSSYKWQDGLGYYESTRDTASHFFFDALPKGTYVFEYSTRVQLRGACQAGVAELQCMYAPDFNSHSAFTMLEVE